MKRLKERYEDYTKALNRLKEALLEEPTDIVLMAHYKDMNLLLNSLGKQ